MRKFEIKPPMVVATILLGAFVFWIGCEIESIWLSLVGFVLLFIGISYCSYQLFKIFIDKIGR